MSVIQARTEVTTGATSAWFDTSGNANLAVGVEGTKCVVEYNLGTDTMIFKEPVNGTQAIIVAKAEKIRLVNNGVGSAYIEIAA